MMKGQIDDAAAIATHRTASPRLLNQDPLQLLLPSSNRLTDTSLATPLVLPLPPAVVREVGQPVPPTSFECNGARSIRIRRPTPLLNQRHRCLHVRVDLPLPPAHESNICSPPFRTE